MKRKREDVANRREYMKTLILANPTMTGAKLNELFAKKYGDRLRINTVYDLKEEVGLDRRGKPKEPSQAPLGHIAARAPGEKLIAFPMMISIDPGDTAASFAQKLFSQLQDAGVVNLKITGSSPTWIVVEPSV